ncbi:nectin-3 isoform X1 [Pelobates cultripes]|uniref:Nectin-3 n=1 Tax=Pelobates cultripes TaxID=61616 RepID=A0AAD1R0M4_PELCU|nr:nectin-3 isoform X1 [Pelobates cultripes]
MACAHSFYPWHGVMLFLQYNSALIVLLLCLVYGSFSGPVHVDTHVTAVWGKNITLKCLIEVNETITQISWEKIIDNGAQTIAVHHPIYGTSFQEFYQDRTMFKNESLHDATIIIRNIDFSDSGEYICKAVTFPLGNIQSSTTVVVFVEPTVGLTKGVNPLIDGANETVGAFCIASTGKPAAEINWEVSFGRNTTNIIYYPNKTVTVISQYWLIPTKFVKGRNITCVVRHPTLANDLRYPFTLDIQYVPEVSVTGYDGNWFIGRTNVHLKCNADANPPPKEIKWSRLDGYWPEGVLAVNNTLHFIYPLSHNFSGIYLCKVANELGQKSEQKIITILDPPATTLLPRTHSAFDLADLATSSKMLKHPPSTMATKQGGHFGTIFGCLVGGSLFLIFSTVLFGVFYYRRKQIFRGDYFTKSYIPPSDMEKESQIDVIQPENLDHNPNSMKQDERKTNLIYNEVLQNVEHPEWNNRCQEQIDRPVNPYNNKIMSKVSTYDTEDDLVSHIDGSVISRREWYV